MTWKDFMRRVDEGGRGEKDSEGVKLDDRERPGSALVIRLI